MWKKLNRTIDAYLKMIESGAQAAMEKPNI